MGVGMMGLPFGKAAEGASLQTGERKASRVQAEDLGFERP